MKLPAFGSVIGVRLLAVITLVIFASQLMIVVILWRAQETQRGAQYRLPLPGRAAAIVEAVESTPPETRDALLTALNGKDLQVRVEPSLLRSDTDSGLRVEAFRRAINRYSDILEGRRVIGMIGVDDGNSDRFRKGPEGFEAGYPMRIIIELRDGTWLVLETPNLLAARIARVPLGFFAGLFGFVVAALAVWIIWHDARKVKAMAVASTAFAETNRPHKVQPAGGRDVRALISAFNAMQDQIASLIANRLLVTSAMSHDVRTYLTRLRLRIEGLDPTSRAAAEKTLADIQGLLDDTLAFATSGRDVELGTRIDLAEVLNAILVSGQFPQDAVTLEIDARPCTRGHPGRLQRAIVNLVSNAVKYGGRADVRLSLAAGQACIVIADRGPGIPEAERDKVFEPFFRRDASRNRNTEGAGLGLAIAQNVIRAHRGTISLAEREGGGLRVIVRLRLDAAGYRDDY